jgi:hypothetical protein
LRNNCILSESDSVCGSEWLTAAAALAAAAVAAAMVLPQAVTGPGPRLIQEGDLAVVYESYNAIKAVYVDSKKGQYANRFGNFQHKVRAWLAARASAPATGRRRHNSKQQFSCIISDKVQHNNISRTWRMQTSSASE